MASVQQRLNIIAPEIAAETQVWMRYLLFRSWIEDRSVIDLGATTRFGARYASILASQSELATDSSDLETPLGPEYFQLSDASPDSVCCADFETVFCFEYLDRTTDPETFLAKLAACEGNLAIGCSPNGTLNQDTFRSLIETQFEGRSIQFFAQSPNWPYRLTEEFEDESLLWVAAIGDIESLAWPKLGFAMPTMDQPAFVVDSIIGLTRSYPGEFDIALVANGSNKETLEILEALQLEIGAPLHVLESETNLGYGQGCNRGLDYLQNRGGYAYYGVVNDDVLPDTDCMCELVHSMRGLEKLQVRPGAIGPVSNNVNGGQQIELGSFNSYPELVQATFQYRKEHHSSATQVRQIRGLMLLITAECIETIGGFDPCFGIGNFEDDDHNLRCHLAGFTLWIADGSFLYHHGSSTFKNLEVDYEANIRRNAETLAAKWRLSDVEQWVQVNTTPEGVSLEVPLSSWQSQEDFVPFRLNGETIDLIKQASDIEFAAWVISRLQNQPREARRKVVESIQPAA